MCRLIIAGSRNCKDRDFVFETIDKGIVELEIKPTEIVSGNAAGVDKIGEEYGKERGINVITFPAKWEDISDCEPANIRERYNKWNRRTEKYNCMAGFERNEKMAKYASEKNGCLIAIDLGTNGTKDMIEKARQYGLKVYVYQPEPIQPHEFGYNFWSE